MTDSAPSSPGQSPIFFVVTICSWIPCFYLLLFVVPKFNKMFDSLGGKLPSVTVAVIGASQFLQSWAIPAALLAALCITVALVRSFTLSLSVFIASTCLAIFSICVIIAAIFIPILELQAATKS